MSKYQVLSFFWLLKGLLFFRENLINPSVVIWLIISAFSVRKFRKSSSIRIMLLKKSIFYSLSIESSWFSVGTEISISFETSSYYCFLSFTTFSMLRKFWNMLLLWHLIILFKGINSIRTLLLCFCTSNRIILYLRIILKFEILLWTAIKMLLTLLCCHYLDLNF